MKFVKYLKLSLAFHRVILFVASRLFVSPNDSTPKKVLIVRIDSIGDFVIFTSTLKYLREKYKGALITLICNRHVARLAETSPYIDQVVIFYRGKYRFNPVYRLYYLISLIKQRFDLSLHPVYSREPFGDELAVCASRERRITFVGDDSNIDNRQRLKNNKLYTSMVSSEHDKEIDKYLDFLAELDIKPGKPLKPELWLEEKDRQGAREILIKQGVDLCKDKFCLLFPGAQLEIKTWPSVRYSQLGDLLYEKHKIKVVIGGGQAEKRTAREIASRMTYSPYDIAGQTGLREIAAILEYAAAYIGNDTGILHVAAAMGTPTVCIMGGGHFGRFFPCGDENNNKVVYNRLDCFGCNWQCVYDKAECLELITVDQVYEAVGTIL
jgi:ADP-heptose:LPS heptosyltransferase